MCGFCKQLLLYECNSDHLTTFFIPSSILGGFAVALLLLCCCTHPKVMTKMAKKCLTDQRFIWKRNTTCKIHTLVLHLVIKKNFSLILFMFWWIKTNNTRVHVIFERLKWERFVNHNIVKNFTTFTKLKEQVRHNKILRI